jgi:hypothetical protein
MIIIRSVVVSMVSSFGSAKSRRFGFVESRREVMERAASDSTQLALNETGWEADGGRGPAVFDVSSPVAPLAWLDGAIFSSQGSR